MYYTYLLKLFNGDYYAGSTSNLKNRLEKVELVWYSGFKTKELASEFEDYLKSSSGKAFRNKRLIDIE